MRHLTFANVTASLALFVSLGGSSYAAVTLSRDSVRSRHIDDGQVRRPDIARNAIDSARVRDGSLRAKDFARGELRAGPVGATGAAGVPGPRGPEGERGPQGPGVTRFARTFPARGDRDQTDFPLVTVGALTYVARCFGQDSQLVGQLDVEGPEGRVLVSQTGTVDGVGAGAASYAVGVGGRVAFATSVSSAGGSSASFGRASVTSEDVQTMVQALDFEVRTINDAGNRRCIVSGTVL